jgi:hypothetical protein
MLTPATARSALCHVCICYFQWFVSAPCSAILAVCDYEYLVLLVPLLKERGEGVLLSGVQFIQCFEYRVIRIDVWVVHIALCWRSATNKCGFFDHLYRFIGSRRILVTP